MKKSITTLVFLTYSLLSFGQKAAPTYAKSDDLKTGIRTIQTSPASLTPELTYVLIKEKNKAKNEDSSYFMKITMKNPFTKTLNNELTVDLEIGNGDFVSGREIKENSGWFDGTFTIPIKNVQRAKEFGITHFIIRGEKTQIYCIDKIINADYKKTLKELSNMPL
jgi:hypothetical protein